MKQSKHNNVFSAHMWPVASRQYIVISYGAQASCQFDLILAEAIHGLLKFILNTTNWMAQYLIGNHFQIWGEYSQPDMYRGQCAMI